MNRAPQDARDLQQPELRPAAAPEQLALVADRDMLKRVISPRSSVSPSGSPRWRGWPRAAPAAHALRRCSPQPFGPVASKFDRGGSQFVQPFRGIVGRIDQLARVIHFVW